MSDANLSEHEWRLKMASEGKAIYVPGRSVEEVKAELAAAAAVAEVEAGRVVRLARKDWSSIDTAISDTIETIRDLRFLLYSMSYEKDLDQPWVNAALRLASRAMEGIEDKELATLDRLDKAIRQADKGDLT